MNAPPRGVTGPIGRELLRLAVPVYASQLLRLAYQWVDALWVRGLGVEATAAVTTSVFVMWAVYSINDVVAIGVTAYVSQLTGAGERQRAGVAAAIGLAASAVIGVLIAVPGALGAHSIYRLMHAEPGVLDAGTRYLSVVLGAAAIPMTMLTCETILRSGGDTRTPLAIDLAAVGLNAALDPLLIYGWGPVPALGVAGAAWATVFSQLVAVVAYLTLAARGHHAFPLARRAPGAPVRLLGIVRVGLPAAMIGLLFSVVYVAFARAAGIYGAAALAVVGIANRIEALHFISSLALGFAGGAMVGQNLGAQRPDRAIATVRIANVWSLGISIALMIPVLIAPNAFIAIFTQDPEAHRLGAPYLRILSLCMPFVGVEIVTSESILGSGHTTAISTIYTVFSVARIFLASAIPVWTGSGIIGIAWLITITVLMRTAWIVGWALRRTWTKGLSETIGAPAGLDGT